MKHMGVVLGLVLTGAAGGAHAACAIPAPVKAYLAKNPGWKVLDEAALSSDDRQLWRQYHAGKCPGIASANFRGSGQIAFAVAMTKGTGKTWAEQVLLFDRRSVRKLRVGNDGLTVVWTGAPGKLVDILDDRTVVAKHPTFILEALESSAEVFYYADGKIGSVWTSD